MKVIRVDNYDREIYADRLIAENLTVREATVIADGYNDEWGGDEYYFKVVPDDYVLFKGFEP